MLDHVERLCRIPGADLLFGGKPLEGHSIPACYGALQPTAVQVPIVEALSEEHWNLVTHEVFGPVQVVIPYTSAQLHWVLAACERMGNRLTAAVVSRDPLFLQQVLGATTNGTTYAGMLARTTGAPQNHWFGPASDPRGGRHWEPGGHPRDLVLPPRDHHGPGSRPHAAPQPELIRPASPLHIQVGEGYPLSRSSLNNSTEINEVSRELKIDLQRACYTPLTRYTLDAKKP